MSNGNRIKSNVFCPPSPPSPPFLWFTLSVIIDIIPFQHLYGFSTFAPILKADSNKKSHTAQNIKVNIPYSVQLVDITQTYCARQCSKEKLQQKRYTCRTISMMMMIVTSHVQLLCRIYDNKFVHTCIVSICLPLDSLIISLNRIICVIR